MGNGATTFPADITKLNKGVNILAKFICWAKKHKNFIESFCMDFCFSFLTIFGAVFGSACSTYMVLHYFNFI